MKRKRNNGRTRTAKPKRTTTARDILETGANGATVQTVDAMLGYTEYNKRTKTPTVVSVPTFNDDNATKRAIRLHELIHARNCQNLGRFKQHSELVRNAYEDCKVHSRYWPNGASESQLRDALTMAAHDVRGIDALFNGDVDLSNCPFNVSPVELATYALTRSLAVARNAMETAPRRSNTRRVAQRIRNRCNRKLESLVGESFTDVINEAVYEFAELKVDERRDATALSKLQRVFDSIQSVQDKLNDTPTGQFERVDDDCNGDKLTNTNDGRRFEIIELKRTEPTTRKLKAPRRRFASSGSRVVIPRLIDTVTTSVVSSRLFQRKQRVPIGGAVLIDASGSMSCTTNNLNALCELLPFALVAFYEGQHHGHVVIYANDGKRAKTCSPYPIWGGNDVDDFALEWLLKQQAPRLFITDLGFTDPNSSETIMLTQALARRGDIELMACDIPDAIELLKAK